MNLAIVCIVIILTQYGNSDDQFGNPQAVFLIQSNFRRCGLDLKSSLIGFSRLLLRKRQRIIFEKCFLLKINIFFANVNKLNLRLTSFLGSTCTFTGKTLSSMKHFNVSHYYMLMLIFGIRTLRVIQLAVFASL